MIIGMLGGGQLGLMMAESARRKGHEIQALDHVLEPPIKPFCTHLYSDGFNAQSGYQKLYENCDVLTYEFENVSMIWVEKYQDKIPQKTKALQVSSHRLIEKDFAKSLLIPTPSYTLFNPHHFDSSFPFVLKTTTLGYDGHGQYIIRQNDDLNHIENMDQIELIKEDFIDFDDEISVILTRDRFGKIVVFPVPRNIHRQGILYLSIIDDKISQDIKQKAIDYATLIIENLDYVGTLAVEFFVVGQEVIFNEFAPRPHNSGHYTIEGCDVSQFDNHIFAITGQHVIAPKGLGHGVMINLLGHDIELVNRVQDMKDVYIHLYGKKEVKPRRKMGHITIMGDDYKEKLFIISGEQL